MGKYFGTDGFRGEANVVLTVEHAFKVGRYLGWYFNQEDHKARVVIGKDTRRSSYMFEYALAAGLTASGADAYLLHVTTTPIGGTAPPILRKGVGAHEKRQRISYRRFCAWHRRHRGLRHGDRLQCRRPAAGEKAC